ncbi:serine/threonine-protein kinase [Parafrankia elaeagni]|uniref:serine/threonine-protein kinase n=1 Tax=Parafrankia elaeagni TaxID=222534 RepID=UPI0003A497FC|nr:serine/threonine-protein kinase [Parafrankia elaeagni]
MMVVDHAELARALPHYLIGEKLGSGSFGLVLAATHREMGRPAAIKVMPALARPDDTGAEDRLLATLDHPHVVRVYDSIRTDALFLVVMELLAGGTLTRRQADLGPEQVCALGLAVAAALTEIHRSMLHRDLKPDNILFTADGRTVKVSDFGIAKPLAGAATTASKVVGTPVYMAPEQLTGGRLTPATDLYALATVLYQMLSGRPPFRADHLGILWQQKQDGPPPLTDVPGPVAAAIMRALAADPGDRYSHATGFSLALAQAAAAAYGPRWISRTGMHLYLDDDVRRAAEARQPCPPTPPDTLVLPDALVSAHDLAIDLAQDGRADAAHALGEQTFIRRRDTLGPDHPDTLVSAFNLAVYLGMLGRYREARAVGADVLATRRRILGHLHPDTLRAGEALLWWVQQEKELPAPDPSVGAADRV